MRNGFVLMSVLIFMLIFSLLSVYGLTSIQISQKSNQHAWDKHVGLAVAESKLNDLERSILESKADCLRSVIPASVLLKKSNQWWQENACNSSSFQYSYFYFMEYLGQDSCVMIQSIDDGQQIAASFYRISLLTIKNTAHPARILLQSTIAKQENSKTLCQEKIRLIPAGVQAHREL